MRPDSEADKIRARRAVDAILDGRLIVDHRKEIGVTLDHAVAAVLMLLADHDPRVAARYLQDALMPNVEDRFVTAAKRIREEGEK